MRLAIVVLLAWLASGCISGDSSRPAYIQSNLVRMELPERPSRGVRVSAGAYDSSTFVMLTPDQNTQPPSATQTTVTEVTPNRAKGNDEMDEAIFGRLDLTFGKRLTLGLSAPRYGGPTLGHVRLYLAGPERERARSGDCSTALSGAYGNDHRDESSTRIKRSELDVGLVLGCRMFRPVMLYGGPYYQRSTFSFDYTPSGGPVQHGEGDVRGRGGHLGLAFFAGRFSSFVFEYSRAEIDAPGDRATLGTFNAEYQLDF